VSRCKELTDIATLGIRKAYSVWRGRKGAVFLLRPGDRVDDLRGCQRPSGERGIAEGGKGKRKYVRSHSKKVLSRERH